MNSIFYIGATGLNAQQTAVDVVANNIANVNTAAFKRGSVSFAELLTSTTSPDQTSTAPDAAAGVAASASLHVFTDGELRATSNPMDLAIQGDGFVELTDNAGQAVLWRGGTLHVGTDGYLDAPNGQPLKAMISVPTDASDITITPTGQVLATLPSQTAPQELGQIDMVMPHDTSRLEALGDGLYQMPDDGSALMSVQPGDDTTSRFAQGFSEASNVQLSDELVSLMIYQRAYAANARLVQVGDELMGIANGLKR